MFERFSEKARRAIFFARYYVTQDMDSQIRPVHLLAGIHREAPTLLEMAGLTGKAMLALRNSPDLVTRGANRNNFSNEVPLDEPAKRALLLADKQASNRKPQRVELADLLMAVFHSDLVLQKKLIELNVTEEKINAACQKYTGPEAMDASWGERANYLYVSTSSGIGYDLHRLAEGRKLILGGIEVPFEKGPVGHSDGDALAHAICDALLGAAGLGDIGTHFPDSDPEWKDASSLKFLERTRQLLDERGLRITHIDAIVILERPKLGPRFPAMRVALAKALGIAVEQINLKAKTNEGVGEIGRGEAIAAQAIATIER
jgi:2-C-methyl-D-erythritol 2,4-cyclodiphosphate synthase